MKKTLIGLATFALTLLPATAFAQSQQSTDANSTKVENVKVKKEGKGKKDKKGDRKGDKKNCDNQNCAFKGKKGTDGQSRCKDGQQGKFAKQRKQDGRRGGKAYNDSVNFASLNLNDTQKAQLQALNNARRASAQEMKAKAREARMAGDTTIVFDGSQIELLQSKYLKDVREVLTADQYVQFLENNYVKGNSRQGGKMGKMGKMAKGPRKGNMVKSNGKMAKESKGPKGDKQSAKLNTSKTNKITRDGRMIKASKENTVAVK